MSGWYWALWGVVSVINAALYFYWMRVFMGWSGTVVFDGRVYRVTEQRWDLDTETRAIVAEHVGTRRIWTATR